MMKTWYDLPAATQQQRTLFARFIFNEAEARAKASEPDMAVLAEVSREGPVDLPSLPGYPGQHGQQKTMEYLRGMITAFAELAAWHCRLIGSPQTDTYMAAKEKALALLEDAITSILGGSEWKNRPLDIQDGEVVYRAKKTEGAGDSPLTPQ